MAEDEQTLERGQKPNEEVAASTAKTPADPEPGEEKPDPLEVLVKSFLLWTTQTEEEILELMREQAATNKSNILRRGVKCLAREMGIPLPPGAFEDRTSGNRLPRKGSKH